MYVSDKYDKYDKYDTDEYNSMMTILMTILMTSFMDGKPTLRFSSPYPEIGGIAFQNFVF